MFTRRCKLTFHSDDIHAKTTFIPLSVQIIPMSWLGMYAQVQKTPRM